MLSLHNTISGKVEEFRPQQSGKVSMYVCGLTPYDSMHLGHARTLIAFDFLKRWMEYSGLSVMHIQNVTDIDDKIIKRAQERKILPLELSAKYDAESREQMKTLGLLPPTHMPKISEFIPQTIALIEKIISHKHAYITKSGVYFDIPSFENYGKLSGQDLLKIRAGARIEIDENKKNPEDFALWKIEKTPGATYSSPWGEGRPGWHIECSAMSLHYTRSKPLDIHGGARDLIFPHHENEVAQSEASGTVPFVKYWVHSGFLTVNGEKMAKSLGNFITVSDALKKFSANELRMFFAMAHYRSPIDFSEPAVLSARKTLSNVTESLSIMHGEGANSDSGAEQALKDSIESSCVRFDSHMDNDLDCPHAIGELISASKEIARARVENKCSHGVLEACVKDVVAKFAILGIKVTIAGEKGEKHTGMPKEEVEALITQREEARKKKDFATADSIRNKLSESGVILEDSKDGIKWRYS